MPAPLYVRLTAPQRTQRQALRRDPALHSPERDRVAMFLLSDQGWTVPRLALHLGRCEATVRRGLRPCEAEGVGAVRPKPLGTGPPYARRRRITQALQRLRADEERVGSAVTRAQEGLHLRPRTVRQYLHRMGARYRRTTYTVRHPQDPARVTPARRELAALKKSPETGNAPSFTGTRVALR